MVGPPDSGSSTSGSYVVSCTDARPLPPTHFLPSAASSPSHLPAGHGEKFRRTRAHVQLGTRLRRIAGPKGKREEGGTWDRRWTRIEDPSRNLRYMRHRR